MITVHCGLHKTGSTSIQAALDLEQGRRDLVAVTPHAGADWSMRLAAAASVDPGRRLVVSDENILGEVEDAYAAAAARVLSLAQAMDGRPYEVVVYARPQLDWLTSVYLQLVQQGEVLSPDDFWEGIRSQPFLRWTALVRMLAEESTASRVRVRAYVPGRDVVADFFGLCGLGRPPEPTRDGVRINVSIAAVQAPILMALNKRGQASREESIRLRHTFQDRLARGARQGLSPFRLATQQEIVEEFRDDWRDLALVVGDEDPDEGRVFHDAADRWEESILPFAGDSLVDPDVQEELLRSIAALAADRSRGGQPGTAARVIERLRANPADLPHAVRRRLMRGWHRRSGGR